MRDFKAWWPFFLLLMLCACGPKASSIHGTTEGYDLDNPMVIQLPTALNEISGLWYYAKDTSLFAIEDESGFLYKIFPKHPDQIQRWKFHGHGDFEDLCVVDGTFYILRSDGDLFATSIPSGDAIQSIKYEFPESGNEFESLYYDDSLKLIMLICKDCKNDEKESLGTIAFDPATRQFVHSPLSIDSKSIASVIGEKSVRFKPSAATINPFNGEIFLLSSVNKLLVTAKRDGSIIQAYPLAPKSFKQPEGMAIGADRTLYISNEAASKGAPNILVFPYRTGKK